MKTPTQSDFLNILSKKMDDFIPLAVNLGRSRFLLQESEIQAPDEDGEALAKEVAEMEAIAEAFRCEIIQTDNSFALNFYMDDRNPGGFLEIVDAGMDAPLAGGDPPPTSHNPDGSTYPTPTPIEHWYDPVPGYAKPATGVINEIKIMLKDLFLQHAKEAIAESKSEFIAVLKQYVASAVSSAAKG